MIIVCVLVKLNKSNHHLCFSGIHGLFFTFCVLIIICGLYLLKKFQCLDLRRLDYWILKRGCCSRVRFLGRFVSFLLLFSFSCS